FARQPDLSAHHVHQPLTDRQAKAGAAELARCRAVGLCERSKESQLYIWCNANAGVTHLATYDRLSRSVLIQTITNNDFTALGKFDSVTCQIEEDLSQAPRVAAQPARRLGFNLADQFQSLNAGLLGEKAHRLFDGRMQVEVNRFEF